MPAPLTLSPEQVQKLLAPQGLQVNLDPVSAAVLPFVSQAMDNWKVPPVPAEVLPEGWRKGMTAAMIQWWKRARGDELPSYKTIRAFGDAARQYMTSVGGYLPAPERIPWGVINLIDTGTFPEVLAAPIDWSIVSNAIEQLPAGLVKISSPVTPDPSYQTSPDHWLYLENAFDWEGTPWDQIPWTGIPWARLDVSSVQDALARKADKKAVTASFVNALFDAYEGLANEAQTDLDLPKDWGKTIEKTTDEKTDEKKTSAKRDGMDWILAVAGIGSALAIIAGTIFSFNRGRKKKP